MGLIGAALVIQAGRKKGALVEEDEREFAEALDHLAAAAFMIRGSPREMKRFLNRLRFVAADPTDGESGLGGATLVGLAVIAHAERDVVQSFAEGKKDLLAEIDEAKPSTEPWDRIKTALDTLSESKLPLFEPTEGQASRLLDLWTGITVRG